MVFDCGEGTQRQMMRFGTGFSFHDIFFTHLHADHFLGVIGLLGHWACRTARSRSICGPPRRKTLLQQAIYLG